MSGTKEQGKHTPGPCGCHMEPVNDATEPCDLCSEATETFNGIGWKIVRCSTHAAAPELLDACKQSLKVADELMTEFISKKRAANWGIINDGLVAVERAIAKAEGR